MQGKRRNGSGKSTRTGRCAGIVAALTLGVAAVPGTVQAALNCASLTTVTPEASTITSAAIVTPPATVGGAAVTVPFCRVQGTARPSFDSEIKFEVWLPPTVGEMLTVSDMGATMPPKSTWFEPKLKDGLLIHLI